MLDRKFNMNKLFIIGNGFDIAHNIPSSYGNFRDYCAHYMPEMYEKLNRYYDGGDKLWSEFEKELPSLNQDALFGWATVNNANWNQSWDGYYTFIDEIRDEVDYVEGLKLYFTEWIQSISLEDVRKKYNLPIDDCLYLTFNYTLTLENVYHIPAHLICHIHGKAEDEFSQIEVGHNMSDEEVSRVFSSDNDFEDEACEEVANLVKGWRKKTEEIVASNEAFFSQLGDVKDVYVLGHSMNDIDMPYYTRIKQGVAADAVWHISVYDEKDTNKKEAAACLLQRPSVDYIKLDNLLLCREGDLLY